MIDQLIKKFKTKGEDAIRNFTDELRTVHTGRASSILVENISISYYGTNVPLKQVAQINIPQNNMIVIQPWDKSALVNIEAGVRESNLNLNPVNDGKVIRLTLPSLTEDRRKELNKIVQQAAENSRIVLRNERRKTWEEIQNLVKSGKATEDDKYQSEEDLNKAINEFNDKIEKILKDKEKEIMGQ